MLKERITSEEERLSDYEKELKNSGDEYDTTHILYNIKTEKESIERATNAINVYNGDCKGTFLEETFIAIEEYEKKPDAILSVKYKVSYSLTNPILKVKQTFDRCFYTNRSGTEFMKEAELE